MPKWWLVCQGVLCIAWLWLGAMVVRLEAVKTYRHDLVEAIHSCAHDEEAHGHAWRWRYDAFDGVTFDRMMWEFYKPLRWFYPDARFTRCTNAVDPVDRVGTK